MNTLSTGRSTILASKRESRAIRWMAIVLSLLLGVGNAVSAAQNPQEPAAPTQPAPRPQTREEKQATKIRAKVHKLGVGPKARATVFLKNEMALKGYISKIEADSFELTNPKTGKVETIRFADAKAVSGPMSRATKVVLIVGVCVGVLLLAGALAMANRP